ncbi:MAG: class I SAM-dependent methyltransferase [Gemmataceae bacterium]
MPADWELPPGVSRGLWDYLRDPAIADEYDRRLHGTPLLSADLAFVREHLSTPGRVIDLGCGTGRLAVDLAARGFFTVAVDLSEEMLRVAAAKARDACARVQFAKANLVDLRAFAEGSFDYAACLFHTLGMIAGDAERRRALVQIRRLLKPGGLFVLHVHNVWYHLGTRGGRRLLWRSAFNRLRGQGAFGDFVMPPHQGLGEMPMHLFSRRELKRLLNDAEFAIETCVRVAADGGKQLWSRPCYGYLIAARAV